MVREKTFLVGGVKEIDDKWHGFFDKHRPCDGTATHANCVVVEQFLSPPFDTQQEAIAAVYDIRDKSGLEGWEIIGPKA